MLAPRSVALILGLVALPSVSYAQPALPAVYTSAQAARGKAVYTVECMACHGPRLDDGVAVPIAGRAFRQKWSNPLISLDDLFFIIQTTMPKNRGNALPAADYVALTAYVLEQNGYPTAPMSHIATSADRRAVRLIDTAPIVAPDFLSGDRSATPTTAAPTQAALSAAAGDPSVWLHHTQNYAGTRASAATELTPANAGQLQVRCVFQMGEASNFQTGPLVFDGVLFATTVHVTAAIDATTCQLKWRHVWAPQGVESWRTNRGVALKDGRVYRATTDGYLLALDAADGRMLWARRIADTARGEALTMPPLVFEDRVIIGPAGSENSVKGWIGAFRADTGQPDWRFNIVPSAGEPGSETWTPDAPFPLGGGGVWTALSLDVARGQLFVATTNPAPDLPAALRGGNNLYTNSLLAIDVRTGKLAWHDQMVPADGHDWDLTHASPLIHTTVNGTARDLVITVGKAGLLRASDRVTKERLYETAVTTRQNADAPVTTAGTHACPGILGGVEWNGPAYNAGENLLFVPAVDWCGTFTAADAIRYVPGANYLGGTFTGDPTRQGWLTAVDASTGAVRWRYRSARPMVAGVATSAGGVVMTGELTGDFVVFDAARGTELYRFHTGGPIGGGVVTYQIAGRQYIAVTSGSPSAFWVESNPGTPTILLFALPGK